ncbi:MAG: hypothetical protein V1838_03935 [Patescibacteria group bacterium]
MQKQRGQIQVIGILLVVALALTLYFTGVFKPKAKKAEPAGSSSGQTAAPVTYPILSNLSPSGELSSAVTEVTLSVNTDRASYCRYSTEPNKTYSSMSQRFSYENTKTIHTAKIKGLQSGTHTYYVRCSALKGTTNTEDAQIQFKIGAGTGGGSYQPGSQTSDAPPVRLNLAPSGSLAVSTTTVTLSLSTNEAANCRYSTDPNKAYSSMSQRFSYNSSKLYHTAEVKGLTDNKLYKYYVRCQDTKGNANNEDAIISFGVGGASSPGSPAAGQDTIPPSRFNPYPDNDDLPVQTRRVTISLQTDETAICRYSDVSGMSYDPMHAFDNTNSTSHSTEVTGLSEGRSYKYYVKCMDAAQNKNTNDFTISFKVKAPEDVTPPVTSNPYPTGDVFPAGTTQVTMSIRTDESAYCRYGDDDDTYNSMGKSFGYVTGFGLQYLTAKVTGLQNGKSYAYFVRCKDYAGNASTGSVKIYFSVSQ